MLTPRVARLAGSERTDHQRVMAAVLDAGPGSAASHETAAALYGIPGFDFRDLHVTRGRGKSIYSSPLALVHQPMSRYANQTLLVHGVPTTRMVLLLLDLTASLHPMRALRAIENAASRRLFTYRAMLDQLPLVAGRGRDGTVLLREWLEARKKIVHPPTGLERRAEQVLADAGIPIARSQIDLGDDSVIGRIDYHVKGPVLLEVDSDLYHLSPLDAEADELRDKRLEALGYIVVRVDEFDVWYRPWEVVKKVRAALRDAARRQRTGA